jgi:hydroxyacylglutathione hydrolase
MGGQVEVVETLSLGDRSYLVTDGEVAVVIDPQRDVERFLEAAERLGVRITHVLETHVHNDYVSGGLALARRCEATYALSAAENVEFDRTGLTDGDELTAGGLVIQAVHTPGHTPHHLSYVARLEGGPLGLFTGGSLVYGGVGRPDLISPELTPRLARDQYRSAHRLVGLVPDPTPVYPTHGFGSHCASVGEDLVREGTVGEERTRNPALTATDEEAFAHDLLSGLHPYPAYYAHMGALNLQGADAPDLSLPAPLAPDALRAHVERGDWVVDLRQRRAYAAGHVRGTINVELRNDLPTYLGWVIPWGTPFVLLGETREEVAEAQRMLARIGLDRPAGMATGGPQAWVGPDEVASWPVARWVDLAERPDAVVLDVREGWEWQASHHPEALHIPFYELDRRASEIPPGQVWIYCATGNRATVAASLLARQGREPVLLDDFCLPGDTPWAQLAGQAAVDALPPEPGP